MFEERISQVAKKQKKYFVLLAKNGKVVFNSEMYTNQAGVVVGQIAVMHYGIDPKNYILLQSDNGQWYYILRSHNNKVIGHTETYVTKGNAKRGLKGIIKNLLKMNKYVADSNQ